MTPAFCIDTHVARIRLLLVGEGNTPVYRHLDALISLAVLESPSHRLTVVHVREHNEAKAEMKPQAITICIRGKGADFIGWGSLPDKMAQTPKISALTHKT